MNFEPSARAQEYLGRVAAFIDAEVLPVEHAVLGEYAALDPKDWRGWRESAEVARLRDAARAQGLWNLFLPDTEHGAGLSTLDYAPVAEAMGRVPFAPELFNCNAPDTGNMEVLHYFGTPQQKQRWLEPLLDASIRSVFCMTEPGVASSDATNIAGDISFEGDDVVINGRKWWITGIGHPRCAFAFFLGRSDPQAARHQQHSLVLVPMDTPGVRIERMLSVLGEFDAPYGHGEIVFEGVRVPVENVILGRGRGFEIAQGRLGPGRIHHCMRCIGAAERALSLMLERGLVREAFGKPLLDLGGNRERIADLRVAIDQARLLTLHAAWQIDRVGARDVSAQRAIAAIKLVVPNMLQRVVDEAIQMFGAAGLAHDLPLAAFFVQARALRIADGPDAVHRQTLAKLEIAAHQARAKQ
ncbi:MAG: acyl-CoA dehydrogenase family protein [Lysobacterales bacterium]